MELIISQNRVTETSEVSKELIESSVIYKGFDLEGEEINIYDTEGGKIAPYVRYLLEGEQKGKSKIIFYIIIWFIALVLLVVWFLLISKKQIKPVSNIGITSNIKAVPDVKPIDRNEIKSEIIKEIKENEIKENEIKENEIITNTNNISLESQRRIFEIESQYLALESWYDILSLKNIALTEEKAALVLELENKEKIINENKVLLEQKDLELSLKKDRENKEPNDAFIYFLWEYLYKNCELSNNEIKDKCKEIYYNFLKK